MHLLRTSFILISIFLSLMTSRVLAAHAIISGGVRETASSTSLKLGTPLIYNPHKELLNKIKHDKSVAHRKAIARHQAYLKRIAHMRHVQALRRLAKQRAALKTAQAPPRPITPVYHVPVVESSHGCGDNSYAHFIYMHESGCKTHNPNGSGCDGIGQACPSSKVIGPCGYNYACQNAWFSNYAKKYGGWAGAYQFWLQHSWW